MLILLNHADRVLDRLKDPRLLEDVWNNLRQSDTQGHSTAAGVADSVDLHTVFPEESKDEDMKLLHFSCLKDRPYGKGVGCDARGTHILTEVGGCAAGTGDASINASLLTSSEETMRRAHVWRKNDVFDWVSSTAAAYVTGTSDPRATRAVRDRLRSLFPR